MGDGRCWLNNKRVGARLGKGGRAEPVKESGFRGKAEEFGQGATSNKLYVETVAGKDGADCWQTDSMENWENGRYWV